MLCFSGFELYSRWVPLEVLSFCNQERAQTSFNKDNVSGEKKYKEAFRVSIIWEYVRKPKSKSRTRSCSCPQI